MNPLFIRVAPYIAAVVVAFAVLAAAYAKGYTDAEQKWEARHKSDLVKMYQSGKAATDRALKGWKDDIESIRNRPAAPVVRVCPKPRVPDPAGGVAAAPPDGQPGTLGERVAEGRDIGSLTADILDDADLNAARCNRLIEWLRKQ